MKPASGTAQERLEPEPIGALTWLLVAVALLPLAVAMVRVLTGTSAGFHATSDNARNELLVRDVSRHPVLLGPFSRNDWSHPGPLFFYLSAIPYRVNRVRFGLHRISTGGPLRARLLIASGTDIDAVGARPGARRVAYVSRTSPTQRARAAREVHRLTASGVTAFDPRLVALGKDLLAEAIFALPTSPGPDRTPKDFRP